MTVTLTVMSEVPDEVGAVGRGVFADLQSPEGATPLDADGLRRRGLTGAIGESALLLDEPGGPELVVGLGEPERLDREAIRRVGAAIARGGKRVPSIAIDTTGFDAGGVATEGIAQALGEGILLASYRFDRFKSKGSTDALEQVILFGPAAEDLARGIARAVVIAEAVNLARDLVNTPAGDMTPSRFGEVAAEVAAREGLTARILAGPEIAEARLGGLLGVAAGSTEPPRFVELTYEPDGGTAAPLVALVGKGITFDSGGLSIKPAGSMMSMKNDMGGAAAVLAALSACRRLGISVRVRAYLPTTENMPGGAATKPGDVLTIRNGKTIEVLNTDAEGRLVLADALSLAVEDSPDAIVDLATLTGACVTALGAQIAGVLGNDDRLIDALRVAARHAGEALWPLPLAAGYHSHIESEIADMKNIGKTGQAGALSAALLLQEFVAQVPWAHLDIAGPVTTDEDKGYLRKGATGFGVRTLLALLETYEPLGGAIDGEAEGMAVLR